MALLGAAVYDPATAATVSTASLLGWHYDCDGTTDLSNFPLQMQHGVYRGWTTAPLTFTSSGFGFLTSEPER
jgi:hypothetical protein